MSDGRIGDRWARRAGALFLGFLLGASGSDCIERCQERFDVVPTGVFELSDRFLEDRGWEQGTLVVTDDQVRLEVRTLTGATATLTGRRPPPEEAVSGDFP